VYFSTFSTFYLILCFCDTVYNVNVHIHEPNQSIHCLILSLAATAASLLGRACIVAGAVGVACGFGWACVVAGAVGVACGAGGAGVGGGF
jgi:hypothetical protein